MLTSVLRSGRARAAIGWGRRVCTAAQKEPLLPKWGSFGRSAEDIATMEERVRIDGDNNWCSLNTSKLSAPLWDEAEASLAIERLRYAARARNATGQPFFLAGICDLPSATHLLLFAAHKAT